MTLKDILKQDKETFLEDFGEKHQVNNQEMTILIDDSEKLERTILSSEHMDGISKKEILFYVKAEEFGALPSFLTQVKLDKKIYRVKDAIDEDGIYSITLEANRG